MTETLATERPVASLKDIHKIEADAEKIIEPLGLRIRHGLLRIGQFVPAPPKYLKRPYAARLGHLVSLVEAEQIYAGQDLGWFQLFWDAKSKQFFVAEFHLG
jgi:hypothetical protein